MPFLDTLSIEELNRVLTVSKWTLAALAVLTAIAGIFNLWLADRIADLQKAEVIKAQERLQLAEQELQKTKAKTDEVAANLARVTVPRKLTEEQIQSLRTCLPNGPKGKVIVTFLSVENDAEIYSRQIAKILAETGFEVSTPQHLWLQLAVDGIFLGAADTKNVPPHAVHIQKWAHREVVWVKTEPEVRPAPVITDTKRL